ncbi:MAG: dephospho-CoA kinase, partial [Bacteroidota bacterium]|nr:dephospho-CoA kinase [Bacteroidota bacterium]
LVHPVVFRDTERWNDEQLLKEFSYSLREAALLVETGSYKNLDKLIVVTAPLETRVDRVSKRDKLEAEDVMARVRNQLPDEEKIKLANFVIHNDGDLQHLEDQVKKIHQQLLEANSKQ